MEYAFIDVSKKKEQKQDKQQNVSYKNQIMSCVA